jgi:hypothetical protein
MLLRLYYIVTVTHLIKCHDIYIYTYTCVCVCLCVCVCVCLCVCVCVCKYGSCT